MLLDQQVGPVAVQSTQTNKQTKKAITYQFIFYSTSNIQDNVISFVQEHDLDNIFQQNQDITIKFICTQKAEVLNFH